ncbi:MAG: hypothetical protein O3C60_08685 [Planctomycetota bacterium]|nr:hypothetical protein [Planctomycetota bacterium]
MKLPCRSTVLAAVYALGILAAGQHTPSAVAAEPMVVVSATNLQTLLEDIKYVTELAGMADAGKMAVMMARPYTAGLDKSRPVGFAVSPQFQPLVFLPIDDLKTTLSVLKEQIGEPQDAGDGILEMVACPLPVFIKEQNKWAFVSQTIDGLKDLPADPATLLGKLPNQYDLAVRAFVQRVPKEYPDMAIQQMKTGAEEGLRKRDGESDESYLARRKMVEEQLKQMSMLFTEADELTFGARIDRKESVCQFDVLFTALPESTLARQCKSLAKAQSQFTSLVKDPAAFRLLFASTVAPEDMEHAVSSLESMRQVAMSEIDRSRDIPDAETRVLARQVANDLLDVLVETVKSGRADGAVSIKLNSQDVSLALAAYVANPKKMEETLTKAFQQLEQKAELPPLKMNVASHGGVQFHRLTVPIPAAEEKARLMFGSTLDLTLGFGKDTIYVSLGERGLSQVKAVIDQLTANPPVPLKRPVQATFGLSEILAFAQAMDDSPILTAIMSLAKEVKGQDNIRLFVQPIPNGIGYRTEIEQGVIKILGQAAQAAKPKPAG